MSSLLSTIEPFEFVRDNQTGQIPSDQFEAAFDYYADRFTSETSAEIIDLLSRIDSLDCNDSTSHLTHRLVSLVYGQLVELVEKAVTDNYLCNDEIVLMEKCFNFITNIIQSATKPERNELYQKILIFNDSFFKFIQYDGWKTMEGHEQIMEQTIRLLTKSSSAREQTEHDDHSTKNDSGDNSSTKSHSEDDASTTNDFDDDCQPLFDAFFQCINSSDGINDYLKAVKHLDTITVTKRDQFLLFDCFNYIVQCDHYTDGFRKQFSNFWLPHYENILKEFLSRADIVAGKEEDEGHLPLNAIKYLVTNLILMQQTQETKGTFFLQGRINNSALKDEYSVIIEILLPLLTNRRILKGLNDIQEDDDHLGLHYNNIHSTTDVTVTFVTWTILKLILMFINANGDCLTYVKEQKKVKNKLFELVKAIEKDNVLIVSIYGILALLMDDQDIIDEMNTVQGIVSLLITYIRAVDQEDDHHRDVKLNELLVTLKALLQHDELKGEFQDDGLPLLMKLAMTKSGLDSETLAETEEHKKHEMEEEFKELGEIEEHGTILKDFQNAAEEIQRLALECFFTVSFKDEAAQFLKKDEQFMNHIRNIVDGNKTTNIGLKKAADGLLWKLEKEEAFKNQQQQTTTTTEKKDEFDMMISYSWDDKPLAHQIYKYLTERCNYRIWLDENEMSGSVCQAMAQAVEKSKIILVCMSEKYKLSDNCHSEAEYAHTRKKIIIPLKMKKVELDGWLGFMIGSKLYIDFSEYDFETGVALLKSEIEKKQGTASLALKAAQAEKAHLPSTPPITQTVSAPLPLASKLLVRPSIISMDYQKIPIESWSEQHVQHFLFDKKLDIMILLTENMNGEELYELFEKCQPQQEYWLMFDRLNKELKELHQQTLPISVYLRFMKHASKYANVSSF